MSHLLPDEIRIDVLPDGCRVFKTPARLAEFLRPILARKRQPLIRGLILENMLETTCERAMGPGVGEGNPDATARVLLSRATSDKLRFHKSLAIYID